MAWNKVKTDPDGASTVTVNQVNDFQRGHRSNLTVFKHFNGDYRTCFMHKRNWHNNVANDGIKHLMENSYTVPPERMEARQFYKIESQYFYNVLQNCVKGGQGFIYIRKHELTFDGRKAFCKMVDFYDRKEDLT
eukprot:4199592-Ditylum_brightwellii.AAC.1